MQRETLPHTIAGKDVFAKAKTGTGKTMSFLIPVIEKAWNARDARGHGSTWSGAEGAEVSFSRDY